MTFPITFPGGGGGVSNPFTEAFVITPAVANVTPLTINQSLTGSAANAALAINPTWNTTGNARVIDIDVTNTASGATSAFARFALGGVESIAIRRDGGIWFTSDTVMNRETNGLFSFGNSINGRNGNLQAANYYIGNGGSGVYTASGVRFTRSNNAQIGFCATNATGALDAYFMSDAAGILSQRNGANAQTFRVANTDDGAGNFERGVFSWQEAANVLHIGTMAGGTGSGRALVIRGSPINFAVGGSPTTVWSIQGTGHFLANGDNLYDIGASGANRPRHLYLGNGATGSIINCNYVRDIGGTTRIDVSGGNVTAFSAGSKVTFPASTTTRAPILLNSGTAPTTPVDGDVWFDGTDVKIRVGGVTKTFTLV